MVMTFPMPTFYRQSQLSIDTTANIPKYFEEDDRLLDDAVLDQSALDSGLEMSPPMVDSRRDSFAIGSSLFSPKQEDWQSADMQSITSTNPFINAHSNNPFMRMDHQQQHQHQYQHQPMSHQPGSWPMSASTSANSTNTPVPQFDGLQPDFESTTSMFQRASMPVQASPFGSTAGAMANLFSTTRGPAMSATSMTASSSMQGNGLGGTNASGSGVGATMPKKMPHSPTLRSHPELRRGDGIRKKNARFEIPAERNLNNIDMLISQTTDEQEIKELKQQKRLLRNRQAALDSRQRKKQHTERLEDEKKHYTAVMNEMEQAMDRLRMQVQELLEEKEHYTEYIKNIELDKEEMVRNHTIETGELRKKISILSGHVQVLENTAVMPNVSNAYGANTGVSAYGDMDGLSMGGSWEHVSLFPDMAGTDSQPQQPTEIKQELQQLLPATRKATNGESGDATSAVSERPTGQGGLLFMLFLVGAFVMSSRQAPSIPRVSEDVRVASAELLENVLKDAGVSSSTSHSVGAFADAAAVPSAAVAMPSHAATATSSWAVQSDAAGSGIVEPSMLGQLSDQLIQPTEQQTTDQMFSLSAAQYTSVVQHYEHPQDRAAAAGSNGPSQGRRNLAEALASMHVNSKAEVVTRSLLWDQIPSDVVHAFAKMVAETQAVGGSDQ